MTRPRSNNFSCEAAKILCVISAVRHVLLRDSFNRGNRVRHYFTCTHSNRRSGCQHNLRRPMRGAVMPMLSPLAPVCHSNCLFRHLWPMEERVGFEPTVPCGTTVFETVPIDHSGTSPQKACTRERARSKGGPIAETLGPCQALCDPMGAIGFTKRKASLYVISASALLGRN